MPDIVNIVQSIQVPQLIKDEFIRNGTPLLDERNRPIHFAGGFAVVFQFNVRGERWAFRCWIADIGNVEKRLQTLSSSLRTLNLPYICDFIYERYGIVVDGKTSPTTRMKWIEGSNLKEFICSNKGKKSVIKKKAEEFLGMCNVLHLNNIAHGDLQHGNIMVDESGRLYLIDYDSMYLPALKGEKDIISGLPDYQHPNRKSNNLASEKLDYFSELIIYLSLISIAKEPSLLDKYQVEGSERLLFAKEDFENLHASQIYHDISSLGDDYIELLSILDEYLSHKDINELRPFTDYLLSNKVSFSTTVLKAKRNTQQVTVKWDVPFKAKVKLKHDGEVIPQDFKVRGQYSTTLNDSSDFCLIAETKAGQLIEKKIRIEVFDECAIEFKSDKNHTYPSVPVTLSWNVTNAKRVTLVSKYVKHTGSLVVEPNKDTTYILRAEDEFGTKEKRIEIKMLPIPQIKTLLVPTPRIDANLNISINRPLFTPINLPFIQPSFSPAKVVQPSLKRNRHRTERVVFQNVRMNLERLSSLIKQRINNKEQQYGKDN